MSPSHGKGGGSRVGMDDCKCICFNFWSVGCKSLIEGERRQKIRIDVKTQEELTYIPSKNGRS